MKIKIDAFENGKPIPENFALCKTGVNTPIEMANNISPKIEWDDAPEGTKSFALVIVDPDVPSKPDDVNQEGKTVPKDLPRVDFYHLVLFDIPPHINKFGEGKLSSGITPRGKKPGKKDYGFAGLNNYTDWFSGDKDMDGKYGGYDGPCPPWNDEIIHRYYFRIYALGVDTLNLSENTKGDELMKAMEGNILAEVEYYGTYTLNKDLLK